MPLICRRRLGRTLNLTGHRLFAAAGSASERLVLSRIHCGRRRARATSAARGPKARCDSRPPHSAAAGVVPCGARLAAAGEAALYRRKRQANGRRCSAAPAEPRPCRRHRPRATNIRQGRSDRRGATRLAGCLCGRGRREVLASRSCPIATNFFDLAGANFLLSAPACGLLYGDRALYPPIVAGHAGRVGSRARRPVARSDGRPPHLSWARSPVRLLSALLAAHSSSPRSVSAPPCPFAGSGLDFEQPAHRERALMTLQDDCRSRCGADRRPHLAEWSSAERGSPTSPDGDQQRLFALGPAWVADHRRASWCIRR